MENMEDAANTNNVAIKTLSILLIAGRFCFMEYFSSAGEGKSELTGGSWLAIKSSKSAFGSHNGGGNRIKPRSTV